MTHSRDSQLCFLYTSGMYSPIPLFSQKPYQELSLNKTQTSIGQWEEKEKD